jgi:hypothetical protein
VKDLRQRVVGRRRKTGLPRGLQSRSLCLETGEPRKAGRLGDGDKTEIEGARSNFEADR